MGSTKIVAPAQTSERWFGAAAPDTGNIEMLAAFGTDEQKKRWLEPLLNQDIFSAYSMTEPQGGSDPNLFRTTAVRDGDQWVINGEKWFTSAGRVADILFVMCTNGMFVVPRTTPLSAVAAADGVDGARCASLRASLSLRRSSQASYAGVPGAGFRRIT